MDSSIVSDLLVSPEEARNAIQIRMDMLEKCSDNDDELLQWFNDTLEELDATFASEARSYFYNNSGFRLAYSYIDNDLLESKNVRRALGILKRMREAISSSKSTTSFDPDGAGNQGKTAERKVRVQNRKVFVVHGHDETVKTKITSTLTKLDFEPVVINEKANQGMTILEKIERHGDVGFAVVAFTPDDRGASKVDAKIEAFEERPRQNVVLELGYFWGKLGRNKVCLLNSIGDKLSSDLQGLGYTPIDNSGHWRFELVSELKAAGYEVDANRLINTS